MLSDSEIRQILVDRQELNKPVSSSAAMGALIALFKQEIPLPV
jgi:hypothetical protein